MEYVSCNYIFFFFLLLMIHHRVDKQFIRPGSIHVWAIAAYDYRLGKQMRDIIKAFQNACKRVGGC